MSEAHAVIRCRTELAVDTEDGQTQQGQSVRMNHLYEVVIRHIVGFIIIFVCYTFLISVKNYNKVMYLCVSLPLSDSLPLLCLSLDICTVFSQYT